MDDDQQGNPAGGAGEPQPGGAEGHEALGSLAEEALKLAGAFTQWAATHGADLGKHAQGMTDHTRGAWDELDEHLATGSPECTVCPVCRAVSAVREVAPEVKEHLGAAAGSLLGAAAGLLQVWNAARSQPSGEGVDADRAASAADDTASSRVQDIVLDDESDS